MVGIQSTIFQKIVIYATTDCVIPREFLQNK